MIVTVLFYGFIYLLGLVLGSFLGVIVDRMPSGESIWKGRSHCDHCRHNLAVIDLIPLVSFFMAKQQCRYCHKKLSWFYPTIEVVTGISFLCVTWALFGNYFYFFFNPAVVILYCYYLFLTATFIIITFTDLKYGIIPFNVVLAGGVVALFWYLSILSLYDLPLELRFFGAQTNIINALLSALGSFGVFFFLFWVTKGRGMGFGDVVFAFLMGLVLGYPRVGLAMYIAFVTGAIVAVVLVLAKRKHFKGETIPFGPFLVLGTFVSMLWGEMLIKYFVGMLL